MRAFLLGVLAWTGSAPLGEGNRLWNVDVQVRGPCAELRLDCGADGTTRWIGPFLAGEERALCVPVPVRSPLGRGGLPTLPLPRAELVGGAAGAAARVLGWSQEQPAERLVRLAGALLARPRPPASSTAPRAGLPELLVVGIGTGFLVRFRRRIALCAGLALLSAGLAFFLARGRRGGGGSLELHEFDPSLSVALLVRAAREELPLPREWLESAPEGGSLEFVVRGEQGSVRCESGELWGVTSADPALLSADRNGWRDLDTIWTRGSSGKWSARGPWPLGAPLPEARPEASEGARGESAPPGWLASGLPSGRGILLGRAAPGEWARCVGFETGD